MDKLLKSCVLRAQTDQYQVRVARIKLHSQERRFEGIRILHAKADYSIYAGLEFPKNSQQGNSVQFSEAVA